MFDKKSKDQNDLDLGEINLLPEDLRGSAEKYKKAKNTKEALYQLRAPKKVKKRRRVLAWLPFFGGEHWEVTPDAAGKPRPAGPKIPDAVAVETNAPKAPEDVGRSATPNEFGIIAPVFGTKTGNGPLSPKTKRSFKQGLSLASFFGKKRPGAPAHSGAVPVAQNVQEQRPVHTFTTPPRHYSLLSDTALTEKEQSSVSAPHGKPMDGSESVSHGMRPAMIQTMRPAPAEQSAKASRKWHLPKWLDIFSLLALFSGPGKARSQSQKRPIEPGSQLAAAREPMPSQGPRPIEPIHLHASPAKPEMDRMPSRAPITPVAVPKTIEAVNTFTGVMQRTPSPMSKAPKVPGKWHLPKWLDIFYWLDLFTRTDKQHPMPPKRSSIVPPAPPKPLGFTPPAPAPQPLQPVITPIQPAIKPVEMKKEQMPVTPITPIAFPKPIEPMKAPLPSIQKTPMPQPKAPKLHTEWHMPKWLTMAFWLHLFRRQHTSLPMPNKHAAPAPPAPKPMLTPMPAKTPVTPPPMPMPKAPAPAMQSVPGMPSLASAAGSVHPAQPVTPAAAPRPVSNDIVAIKDDGDHSKEKKQKGHRGMLFHMPTKNAFANASKELREINLIPGTYFAPKGWKQISLSIGIAVFVSAGLIGLAFGGLHLWRIQLDKQTAAIDTQIESVKNRILLYNDQEPEMSALGNRVELVAQLLNKHVYLTNFFKLLEKYTLPDVYYDGASVSASATSITLSAHGSSFETISRELQLMGLPEAQEFVTKATISNAQLTKNEDGVDQVNFNIELNLNPNLFYYHAG